jgi:hypothetical protein
MVSKEGAVNPNKIKDRFQSGVLGFGTNLIPELAEIRYSLNPKKQLEASKAIDEQHALLKEIIDSSNTGEEMQAKYQGEAKNLNLIKDLGHGNYRISVHFDNKLASERIYNKDTGYQAYNNLYYAYDGKGSPIILEHINVFYPPKNDWLEVQACHFTGADHWQKRGDAPHLEFQKLHLGEGDFLLKAVNLDLAPEVDNPVWQNDTQAYVYDKGTGNLKEIIVSFKTQEGRKELEELDLHYQLDYEGKMSALRIEKGTQNSNTIWLLKGDLEGININTLLDDKGVIMIPASLYCELIVDVGLSKADIYFSDNFYRADWIDANGGQEDLRYLSAKITHGGDRLVVVLTPGNKYLRHFLNPKNGNSPENSHLN